MKKVTDEQIKKAFPEEAFDFVKATITSRRIDAWVCMAGQVAWDRDFFIAVNGPQTITTYRDENVTMGEFMRLFRQSR